MLAPISFSLADIVAGFLYLTIAYVIGGVIAATVQTSRQQQPWQSKDFNEIKPLVSALLRRGYDGGSVRFTHEASDRSIGFRKYILNDGEYGLELVVPQPESLCISFPRLEIYCEENGLTWHEREEGPVGKVSEVFAIECGQDVERAFDVARRIWTRNFGLSVDTPYERSATAVSPNDELVDSREHPRVSDNKIREKEYQELTSRIQNEFSMSPVALTLWIMLTTLGFVFSAVALPIAALFSMNRPGDWAVTLGDITFSGTTASLLLLLAYCLSGIALRRWGKKLNLHREKKSRAETLYAAGARIFGLGLPIAVILVWAGV